MQQSSSDTIAFSDDALRIASAVRRTQKMDKLGSKRRRGEGAEARSAQVDTSRLSALAVMHSAAADKTPRPSESTACQAISACDELSTKPISEGGLGQYFLSESFRRAGLKTTSERHTVPVSFHAIASLPVGKCDDPGVCCSVCLKHFSGEVVTLPCAHIFHKQCIMPWLQLRNSCPCCRAPVESSPRQQAALMPQGGHLRSRLDGGKATARELALRIRQWEGMTYSKMMALEMKADPLVPVSAMRKRKHGYEGNLGHVGQ
jgi:hypothetical protein